MVKIVHWDSFLDLTGSEAVMVDENGVSISYGCLVQLSDEFARDIPQNSLVAVNSENSFEFVVVYLSALRNDFALLILPKKIEKDEQVKIFDNFKVNIHAIMETFNAKSSDIKINKIKVHNTHGVNSKIKLLLMTSGTLSMPKFAKISLENIIANTKSIVASLPISHLHTTITTLPMNYAYGLSILNSHLFSRAKVLMTNHSVLDKEFWHLIKEFKVSSFGGVPKQYEIINKLIGNLKESKSIEYLTQAGGKLSLKVQESIRNSNNSKIKFYVMYGQTEATARISVLEDSDWRRKAGSVGKAIKNVNVTIDSRTLSNGSVKLYNDSGLANYNIGEITITGENVFLGYAFDYSDLTCSQFPIEVLRTGDIGYKDDEGFLFVLGRLNRDAKINGIRVNLDFLERSCSNHFEIHAIIEKDGELCIFAPLGNKKILDFLARDTGLSKSSLKLIEIDQVPLLSTGKINLMELKKKC